ncbi:MAG: primosomal protein N' [Bdellovibrio sp.]|nr:primosomal protein N' [Bdellovibrio sp.]
MFSDKDVEPADLLLSVALPRPLNRLFTYRLPSRFKDQIRVGGWVKVPFGKTQTHAFIVQAPAELSTLSSNLQVDQLKPISEVGDPKYSIPQDVYALCRWAHEYYCTPLGEILNCAAPLAGIRIRDVLQKTKRSRAAEKAIPEIKPIVLTEEQKQAFDEIETVRAQKSASVVLVQGVTGSGKTEIYIEFAKTILAQGKTVLVLVPEIALTPQLHRRFEEGLGCKVGLWHSAVAQGKRQEQSQEIVEGKLRVLVGARSAVFAPLPDLGLIVVDEEHDPTFKQEDRVRYHARDLAIVRGKQVGATVLLGSATPSLETLERVREGKYHLVRLSRRFSPGGLPKIELIDLCEEACVPDTQALLAEKTIREIQNTLAAGEQAMVFLNRRGFASFLVCKDCGEGVECPSCSISLTVHKRDRLLKCHVCGHEEGISERCLKCHGLDLQPVGAGTESLEEELPKLISEARLIRLDRDQITSTTRLNKVLAEFAQGRFNLLLGTQMLVKGHDFAGVTLVVVILADALFRWPDFRASERAFQVLKQVAGRAGRREKPGKVLIQTFDVEHPVLLSLTGQMSETDFLNSERELRQVLGYPPFGRIARFRFESRHRNEAILRAETMQRLLAEKKSDLQILGPSEAFLEKARGTYRWDLLLKSKDIRAIHQAFYMVNEYCEHQRWQFSADVDPFGL